MLYSSFVADMLLLYRCCVIWGSRRFVIASLAIVSFINTVLACAAAYFETPRWQTSNLAIANVIRPVFLTINLVTNLLLTGLIVRECCSKEFGTVFRSLSLAGQPNMVSAVRKIMLA
ncbi:hypothetical protein J3R30DRAFT_225066 [Lentinula aciculospora]|uniref:Uncharacterized protein n=1 Tax=Lentinula aciculospora TaxID=153920 RepID=A0A9W9A981_9AGAR|nr:hypothetical protein J3R30DRAFT_225066 [Lentinula aciculospora]